jgi:hypothetical protein
MLVFLDGSIYFSSMPFLLLKSTIKRLNNIINILKNIIVIRALRYLFEGWIILPLNAPIELIKSTSKNK